MGKVPASSSAVSPSSGLWEVCPQNALNVNRIFAWITSCRPEGAQEPIDQLNGAVSGDAKCRLLEEEALLENSFRRDVLVRGADQWRLRGLLVQCGNS